MSSFDSWFKKKFIDLHDAILCGDLMARNYKKVSKKIYEAGQKSKQAEVDELRKQIEELIEINESITDELVTYRSRFGNKGNRNE